MFNSDGAMYNANRLRKQTVAHAAENYDTVYPLIKDYIAPQSVQEWSSKMFDPNTEADYAAFIIIRELTKISLFIYKYLCLM